MAPRSHASAFLLVTLSLLAACASEVVPSATSGAGGAGGDDAAGATTDASSTAAGGDTLGDPCDADRSMRCDDETPGAILQCVSGKYVRFGDCGPNVACQNVRGSDAVACDTTFIGAEGAPCVGDATAVCDLDREVVLGCDAGTWQVFTHCAPSFCTDVPPTPGKLCSKTACDNCGYTLGDRCSFPSGTVNCSTTGAEIVACEGGIVTLFESCGASGLACTLNGSVLECL